MIGPLAFGHHTSASSEFETDSRRRKAQLDLQLKRHQNPGQKSPLPRACPTPDLVLLNFILPSFRFSRPVVFLPLLTRLFIDPQIKTLPLNPLTRDCVAIAERTPMSF